MKKNFKISLAIVIVFTMAITIMSVFGLHNVVSAADDSVHIIDSCGVVIRESGTYVLNKDLVCSNYNNAIMVIADNVTLDGRGHTITKSAERNRWATGIFLEKVSGVKIKNFNINYFSHGVFLEDSNNNTVENIKASSSFLDIALVKSSNNRITNNFSNGYGVDDNGIALFESNGNYIANNVIKGMIYGLDAYASVDNKIVYNKIVVGKYGMRLSNGCKNNRIDNNFVKISDTRGVTIGFYFRSTGNFGMGNTLVPSWPDLCLDCLVDNSVTSSNPKIKVLKR